MRTMVVRFVGLSSFLGFAAAVACSDNGAVTLADAGPGAGSQGANVGAACNAQVLCRQGLACTSGTCAPCNCRNAGLPCNISDECTKGDYCGPTRTCTTAGSGAANTSCKSDADCGSGLRCNLVGLSAQCEPEGTKDVGGACKTAGDCLAGLACAMGACAPLPPVGDGGMPPLAFPPLWGGETCKDDTGATKAYFHVPRGTADGDFYRLPFPNDVRLTNGKVSLASPPTRRPARRCSGSTSCSDGSTIFSPTCDGFSAYPTDLLPLQRGGRPGRFVQGDQGLPVDRHHQAGEPRRSGLLLVRLDRRQPLHLQ